MRVKPAPLSASFMLTAILGFLISVVYVRKVDLTWAVAFAIVFFIMIIASLISMVQAPVKGQLMPRLEGQFKQEMAEAKKLEPKVPKSRSEASRKPAKRKPKRKR